MTPLTAVRYHIRETITSAVEEHAASMVHAAERRLSMLYMRRRQLGMTWPELHEVGYRVYSESNEDGILHFLFSVIGTTTRSLVDIGAAGLTNSNTRNLLANHAWHGLLIDGEPRYVAQLRDFYASQPRTWVSPPTCLATFVTPDNVNDLLRQHAPRDVDLLCIDIDSVDYWVWRALDVINPRVVVTEYNYLLRVDRSVSVPDRRDFRTVWQGPFPIYYGASLAAMVKLGAQKGYRFIGSNQKGYNAFFVRADLADGLSATTPEACLDLPFPRWAQAKLGDEVTRHEWVEV